MTRPEVFHDFDDDAPGTGERAPAGRRRLPAAHFHGSVAADGDIVAGDKIVQPAAPRFAPPVRQLPAAPRDFVGRERELAAMDEALAAARDRGSATVVQIHGMAGVGKTSLVLHWAHRNAARFDEHIFLDLHGLSRRSAATPARALFRLLGDLGLAPGDIPADEARRAALFRSLVAERRILVVLDNAADAGQIVPLVPGGPGCLAVVTGRTRLEGLVARFGAVSVPVAPLTTDESCELVARLLGGDRGEREPQAVADLADSCGRLPLAIRIAAVGLAAGPFDSVAAVVDELTCGGRLDALALDGDAGPAIRPAFDLSYDALTAREQGVFRMLGLLHGYDFGAESLAALLAVPVPEARRLLRGLVRRHLVEPGTVGRFRLHELLSEYAAERLAREDGAAAAAAARRLLDWYLTRARRARARLAVRRRPVPPAQAGQARRRQPGGPPARARRRARRGRPALRGADARPARRRALRPRQPRRGGHGREGGVRDLHRARRPPDGGLGAQHALARGAAVLPLPRGPRLRGARAADPHPRVRRARRRAGAGADRAGALEPRTLPDRAAARARVAARAPAAARWRRRGRRAGDDLPDPAPPRPRRQGPALRGPGARRPRAARRPARPGTGDRRGEADSLGTLAHARWRLGDEPAALAAGRAALRIHRDTADRYGEGEILDLLARVHRNAGRCAEALGLVTQALALRREIGDRRGEGDSLNTLSRLMRRMGETAEALGHGRRALVIRREIDDRRGEADTLDNLARVHALAGDREEAHRHAAAALEIQTGIGDRWGRGRSLLLLGELEPALGRPAEARAHLARAVAVCAKAGDLEYAERARERLAALPGVRAAEEAGA